MPVLHELPVLGGGVPALGLGFVGKTNENRAPERPFSLEDGRRLVDGDDDAFVSGEDLIEPVEVLLIPVPVVNADLG